MPDTAYTRFVVDEANFLDPQEREEFLERVLNNIRANPPGPGWVVDREYAEGDDRFPGCTVVVVAWRRGLVARLNEEVLGPPDSLPDDTLHFIADLAPDFDLVAWQGRMLRALLDHPDRRRTAPGLVNVSTNMAPYTPLADRVGQRTGLTWAERRERENAIPDSEQLRQRTQEALDAIDQALDRRRPWSDDWWEIGPDAMSVTFPKEGPDE